MTGVNLKVAVIGAFGQLGSDLMPLLGDRAIGLGHSDIEVTDTDSVQSCLDQIQPTHVVNCAAYNLVDKAETESDVAYRVNATGPQNLAQYCTDRELTLMHVSTDYVFGADTTRRTPYDEDDPTGPVSVYGSSKLAGETHVRSICPRHLIVRTCGLYGHRAARGKGNFVETMLRLSQERPELRIVSDQMCTPTSTSDLARALSKLIESKDYGTYHATNSGQCNWYEFACEIFRLSGSQVKAVPCRAVDYGAKARRPDYSVLDCTKLSTTLSWHMPDWHDALKTYLSER